MRPLPQSKSLTDSTLDGVDPGPTPENFHEFFLRYSKPVLSFIWAMIQDRSRAEELCQETFIRALKKIHSRTDHSAPSTWLFGIARNVIREAVRSRYRNMRQVNLDASLERQLSADLAGADQQLISEELNSRISHSLRMLPEDQRLVFVLKLIHNLRYEEIAGITGASIPKLKSDLHRARLEMRQKLDSYLHGKR